MNNSEHYADLGQLMAIRHRLQISRLEALARLLIIAALARHKELLGNPKRVKQVLCETATDLGRERYFQGHGLVDILRALQSI